MVSGSWRLQRLQPALRHRERVVAEVDLLGRLVVLEHREVDDPAELEGVLGDQAQLLADLGARAARRTSRPPRACRRRRTPRRRPRRRSAPCSLASRSLGRRTWRSGPSPRRLRARCSRGPACPRPAPRRSACRRSCAAGRAALGARMRAHHAARGDDAGEDLEVGAGEDLADIDDPQRVAQVGLVGAVVQQRLGIGNARERPPA